MNTLVNVRCNAMLDGGQRCRRIVANVHRDGRQLVVEHRGRTGDEPRYDDWTAMAPPRPIESVATIMDPRTFTGGAELWPRIPLMCDRHRDRDIGITGHDLVPYITEAESRGKAVDFPLP